MLVELTENPDSHQKTVCREPAQREKRREETKGSKKKLLGNDGLSANFSE